MAIGYDVEGFLIGEQGYIPAERVLGGSKANPDTIAKGLVAHPDNVMAEIASAAPFDPANLIARVRADKQAFLKHIDPLRVVWTPFTEFSTAFLDSSVLAAECGCDPDFLGPVHRDPITVEMLGNSRCCGGHIHFDVSPSLPATFAALVCDVMLGVTAIALGERQGFRRQFYGLPGLHRPKPYGLEYRTLSNDWFEKLDKRFANMVLMTALALTEVRDNILMLAQTHAEEAAHIIVREDAKKAEKFYETITGHLL